MSLIREDLTKFVSVLSWQCYDSNIINIIFFTRYITTKCKVEHSVGYNHFKLLHQDFYCFTHSFGYVTFV